MITEEKKKELAAWLLDPDRRRGFKRATLKELEAKLKKEKLDSVYRGIELPLVEVLEDIERTGIKVDGAYLKKLSKELADKISKLEREIYKMAGSEFNLNSPRQIAETLFQRMEIPTTGLRTTKTGLVSTDEETLKFLAEANPIAQKILEYRELFKLRSTYAEPLQELLGPDGRVHTTFLQTGAATGRMASRNPNMQNIPSAGEWADKIRKAFVAERGYTLVEFDYSQVELRVLASVADDEAMIKAFKDGKDIHALTASGLFEVPIEKVSKEMRRVAKTLNFGVSYGMGSTAFSKVAGISVAEAKKFIAKYYSTFTNVRRWQEKTIEKARAVGYVETLTGRKRYLPAINSEHQRFKAEAERVAINAPIQGLEADIIKLAMVEIANRLKKNGWWQKEARMLLTIHDSLLFEIRDDIVSEAVELIRGVMEGIYPLKVPLKAERHIGKNWGEMK